MWKNFSVKIILIHYTNELQSKEIQTSPCSVSVYFFGEKELSPVYNKEALAYGNVHFEYEPSCTVNGLEHINNLFKII